MRIGLLMGTSSIVDCEKDELLLSFIGKRPFAEKRVNLVLSFYLKLIA